MKETLKVLLISVIVFFVIFPLGELFPVLYRPIERKFYDIRMYLNVENKRIPDIVIVDVDEKSLKELGRFYDWPRYNFSKVIDAISSQKPLVIGIDFLFTEPDTLPGIRRNIYRTFLLSTLKKDYLVDSVLSYLSFDRYLILSAGKAENPVFAGMLTNDTITNISDATLKLLELPDAPEWLSPVYTGFISPLDGLIISGAKPGIINMHPDPDGVIRKVPLVLNYQGKLLPSFPLAVVSVISNGFILRNGYISIGGKNIRINSGGDVYVNYRGGFRTFEYVSFSDVFSGRVPEGFFTGKIVLMGTSVSGLSDIRPVPFFASLPGVEIHANTISNILRGDFVHVAEPFLNYLVGFILIFLLVLISYRMPTGGSVALLLLMLAGYLLLSFFLFMGKLLMVEVFRPVLGMILSFLIGLRVRLSTIEFERRKLKETFSRYVPPEIVDKIIKSKDITIKGERREITVLFCDIRNYTGYVESSYPEEVVKELNEYFEEMSKIIFKHNGMIDKFMGDGIMAIFGAPIQYPGHADKAVAAAVEMVKKARDINREWMKEKGRTFEIGIGINTGIAIVGNVGSTLRMEYTAIGDTVNTAARLETLNKDYRTNILISEFTMKQLKEEYNFRNLGKVRLRGKTEEITIFEILPY